MPRRNVIANSGHREDYERLLEAGWSSVSLEKYAAYRFNEQIDASTFRRYRQRMELDAAKVESPDGRLAKLRRDELIDIVQARADLIRLQKARVWTDVGLEIGDRGMGKLFRTTRHEIALLSEMLTAHAEDLQALGVLTKPDERIEVTKQSSLPELENRRLGEILGSDADEESLARVVNLALTVGTPSGPAGA